MKILALVVYHNMVTHDTMNFDNMTNDIYMTNNMCIELGQVVQNMYVASYKMYITHRQVAYHNIAINIPTICQNCLPYVALRIFDILFEGKFFPLPNLFLAWSLATIDMWNIDV